MPPKKKAPASPSSSPKSPAGEAPPKEKSAKPGGGVPHDLPGRPLAHMEATLAPDADYYARRGVAAGHSQAVRDQDSSEEELANLRQHKRSGYGSTMTYVSQKAQPGEQLASAAQLTGAGSRDEMPVAVVEEKDAGRGGEEVVSSTPSSANAFLLAMCPTSCVVAVVLFIVWELAPQGHVEYPTDFSKILANSSLMCERFGFAPEPFWMSVTKAVLQMLLMGWFMPSDVGHKHPKKLDGLIGHPQCLNPYLALFIVYQCLAAWATAYVVYASPRLEGYNQQAWALMYSSSTLSLLTVVVKLALERCKYTGSNADLRVMYPGLEEDLEASGKQPAGCGCCYSWCCDLHVPRVWLEVAVAVACVPLLPCVITHSCVGAICAWPLLVLLPGAFSYSWYLDIGYNTVGKAATLGFALGLLIFTILPGMAELYFAHLAPSDTGGAFDSIEHHSRAFRDFMRRFGPFALFGYCALYCLLFFWWILVTWSVQYRLRSYRSPMRTTTSANEQFRLFSSKVRDIVFRVFLLTVFAQSTASYAALWHEGVKFWWVTEIEFFARDWHVYVRCVADHVEAKLELGWANLVGFF